MSATRRSSRVRRRAGDDTEQSADASQPRVVDQSAVAAEVTSQRTSAAAPVGSPAARPQPSTGVTLPEQTRKKPRRSPNLSSPIDVLAVVELQLCLQFLDTKGKLKAARCCRSMLQAANHPFAWQGPPVPVSSHGQPRLGSLNRQSLLRHAPIALDLLSELSPAEVAAIPRLRELTIDYGISADRILQESALPALRGLQTLRVFTSLPESALRLLPSLPAVRTLECRRWDDASADCSRLSAMPSLTELHLQDVAFPSSPHSLVDAIGQCARLRSLRLRHPRFGAGAFARLTSAPGLHQLRHLELAGFLAGEAGLSAEVLCAGFGALARLESLRLAGVSGVDLPLAHLAHAPALRTLTIACTPDNPLTLRLYGPAHPSQEALSRLLTAAPLLGVRLEVAASIDEWRSSSAHRRGSAPDRQQIDEQWRELRRMGAELERVAIADQ